MPSINSSRFLASSNEIVNVISAKVGGIANGHYKCAIYSGNATTPNKFLGGTIEITNPTNGWYNFSLTSPITITNGNYYWIAVWSESSAAKVYYTASGTLVWMDVAYGSWPSNWVTKSSSTLFKYCIYAKSASVAPPPLVATNIIVLSWAANTNATYYEVWSTTSLMKPMTLLTNVGKNTNVSFAYPVTAPGRFFTVRACRVNTGLVVLEWDKSPDTFYTITSYRVFWGVLSKSYTNTVDRGTNLTCIMSNLMAGNTYYAAATALDISGLESDYSNEVSFFTPSITNVTSIRCSITFNK